MIRNIAWIIFLQTALLLKSQPFKEGDVAFNFNYGIPNISFLVVKTSAKLIFKSTGSDNFSLNFSQKGVFSGRAEYGLNSKLGAGVSFAYWQMTIGVKDNYFSNNPATGVYQNYVDDFKFNLSALAIGARLNYHFVNSENRESKIDPYIGASLGLTSYRLNFSFQSNYAGKVQPNATIGLKSGFGAYFGATLGLRYYPVKPVGLNFEVGYDKGALLFAGLIFKFNTKN